jgi:hypothetical protein
MIPALQALTVVPAAPAVAVHPPVVVVVQGLPDKVMLAVALLLVQETKVAAVAAAQVQLAGTEAMVLRAQAVLV